MTVEVQRSGIKATDLRFEGELIKMLEVIDLI
jgi:hypothetical protein